VSVTERMKEKSLSEVLARMAPAKAMELTTSLAVRKKTGAAATATN
jgi:flagellar motility protein MotE (MotC chaperone)